MRNWLFRNVLTSKMTGRSIVLSVAKVKWRLVFFPNHPQVVLVVRRWTKSGQFRTKQNNISAQGPSLSLINSSLLLSTGCLYMVASCLTSSSSARSASMCSTTLRPRHAATASAWAASADTGTDLRCVCQTQDHVHCVHSIHLCVTLSLSLRLSLLLSFPHIYFILGSFFPFPPLLHNSFLSQVCQCPLCNKTFQKRPDLQINRTLREITEQFRSMRGGDVVGRDKREGRGGGGGGNRGIPDNVFDELKKRLPRSLPKAAVTLTCEAHVKKGELGINLTTVLAKPCNINKICLNSEVWTLVLPRSVVVLCWNSVGEWRSPSGPYRVLG